jgi:hypothetical protein
MREVGRRLSADLIPGLQWRGDSAGRESLPYRRWHAFIDYGTLTAWMFALVPIPRLCGKDT